MFRIVEWLVVGIILILSVLLGSPNVLVRTCVCVTDVILTFVGGSGIMPCPERMFAWANVCSFWWCDKSHIEMT